MAPFNHSLTVPGWLPFVLQDARLPPAVHEGAGGSFQGRTGGKGALGLVTEQWCTQGSGRHTARLQTVNTSVSVLAGRVLTPLSQTTGCGAL